MEAANRTDGFDAPLLQRSSLDAGAAPHHQVPIVYLSSASDNLNIVMAMNMGGDDFIAKPVDPAVLAAKVNAVLRRAYDMPATGNILACGDAVLDLDSAALSIHGQSIPLTRNE